MNNDLISRSALLEAMPKNDEIFSFEVRRVICNAPAVDAEVVRHGRWIPCYEPVEVFVDAMCNTEIIDTQTGWICSECGRHGYGKTLKEMPYCHCGAKMDGKECVPRKCGTCSNDGWDMPQCRECNEENGFKWYKRKMDAEVE